MASYPESIDDLAPPPQKRGWRRFLVRHLPGLSFVVLVGLLIAVVLWPYVVITVPSGHVGVLWKRFNGSICTAGAGSAAAPCSTRANCGTKASTSSGRGTSSTFTICGCNPRTQTYNAISKDGVNVKAQISVRYQLLHNSVAVLHKFIGPDFLTSVVNPEIGSQARQVISQYTAEEVYTSREQIQKQIRDSLAKELGCESQQAGAAGSDGAAGPEALQRFSPGRDPDPRHARAVDRAAAGHRRGDQSADRAVLHDPGIQIPRRARGRRIQAQADRGRRHRRLSEDGQPGHFGVLFALARHRSHACCWRNRRTPRSWSSASGKDGLPIILNAEPNAPGAASQSGGSGASSTTAPSGSGASSSGNSSSNPSGNAAPPAPNSNAPPNTSTAPGATPGGPGSPPNKPPPGTSGAATPVTPEETANAGPVSAGPAGKNSVSRDRAGYSGRAPDPFGNFRRFARGRGFDIA